MRIISLFYGWLLSLFCITAWGRDVLVEFKGACFFAPGSTFKDIYNKAPIFGPEITIQLLERCPWYAFGSLDFLNKHGHSLGLETMTKAKIMSWAFGFKCLAHSLFGDAYFGVGIQKDYLKTKNYSPDVIPCTSDSGLGAIIKCGLICDLGYDLFIDYFADFSFVRVGSNQGVAQCCNSDVIIPPTVVPLKADLASIIFGIGLGCRF